MITMLKHIQTWWRKQREIEAFCKSVPESQPYCTLTLPREDGVKTWTIDELLAEPYEKEAEGLKGVKE